ncbi:MAG: hypothetical protein BWZ10_01772 [candidate division BRC1 bacterium ADurb.BinA364]|nr:MAG: hypothetical protein BWZ10_01772 [candidate division BRC1 bacterium ADurb.BinA364]
MRQGAVVCHWRRGNISTNAHGAILLLYKKAPPRALDRRGDADCRCGGGRLFARTHRRLARARCREKSIGAGRFRGARPPLAARFAQRRRLRLGLRSRKSAGADRPAERPLRIAGRLAPGPASVGDARWRLVPRKGVFAAPCDALVELRIRRGAPALAPGDIGRSARNAVGARHGIGAFRHGDARRPVLAAAFLRHVHQRGADKRRASLSDASFDHGPAAQPQRRDFGAIGPPRPGQRAGRLHSAWAGVDSDAWARGAASRLFHGRLADQLDAAGRCDVARCGDQRVAAPLRARMEQPPGRRSQKRRDRLEGWRFRNIERLAQPVALGPADRRLFRKRRWSIRRARLARDGPARRRTRFRLPPPFASVGIARSGRGSAISCQKCLQSAGRSLARHRARIARRRQTGVVVSDGAGLGRSGGARPPARLGRGRILDCGAPAGIAARRMRHLAGLQRNRQAADRAAGPGPLGAGRRARSRQSAQGIHRGIRRDARVRSAARGGCAFCPRLGDGNRSGFACQHAGESRLAGGARPERSRVGNRRSALGRRGRHRDRSRFGYPGIRLARPPRRRAARRDLERAGFRGAICGNGARRAAARRNPRHARCRGVQREDRPFGAGDGIRLFAERRILGQTRSVCQ